MTKNSEKETIFPYILVVSSTFGLFKIKSDIKDKIVNICCCCSINFDAVVPVCCPVVQICCLYKCKLRKEKKKTLSTYPIFHPMLRQPSPFLLAQPTTSCNWGKKRPGGECCKDLRFYNFWVGRKSGRQSNHFV